METNIPQINENQFLITVPDADNVNHIVVFLTGASAFPEGTGGAGNDQKNEMLSIAIYRQEK